MGGVWRSASSDDFAASEYLRQDPLWQTSSCRRSRFCLGVVWVALGSKLSQTCDTTKHGDLEAGESSQFWLRYFRIQAVSCWRVAWLPRRVVLKASDDFVKYWLFGCLFHALWTTRWGFFKIWKNEVVHLNEDAVCHHFFSSFEKKLWWDAYLRRQEAEARAAAGDGFFVASDIGIFQLCRNNDVSAPELFLLVEWHTGIWVFP